jgi:hypothetical protein
MDRRTFVAERMLAEMDADPAVAALRRRCAESSTEAEFRATRSAWTAAVLCAVWRAMAVADLAGPARPQPTADAPR